MTYEKFVDYVRDRIEKLLNSDNIVKIHKVLKNNDVELDALTVLNKASNVSPTIYLNKYYEDYMKGYELDYIIQEIYDLYEEHSKQLNFNINVFKDYSKICNRIAFKLINTKSNEKLLNDIPSVPFLDLSIVFYCLLDNDYLGNATALIHNIHMDMWNVSVKELYKQAKENTPALLGCELKSMNDMIKEMLIYDLQETIYEKDDRYDKNCNMPGPEVVAEGIMKDIVDEKNPVSMYVLTNKIRTNGAVCMIYDNVLKNFAKEMKKDLFILPSSVHEVILVPVADGITREELENMVKEVNDNELDEIDILSDHIYYYSLSDEKITM